MSVEVVVFTLLLWSVACGEGSGGVLGLPQRPFNSALGREKGLFLT
jgi:hypothetical protein